MSSPPAEENRSDVRSAAATDARNRDGAGGAGTVDMMEHFRTAKVPLKAQIPAF